MKTIKQMSEEYARKAHFSSGVNPNLVESVVYEALTEFKNLQKPLVSGELPSDIDEFYSLAYLKCITDEKGNWQLIKDGVIYNYSTNELYKDFKRGNFR